MKLGRLFRLRPCFTFAGRRNLRSYEGYADEQGDFRGT